MKRRSAFRRITPSLLAAAALNGVILFLASRAFDTRRAPPERPALIVMLPPDVLMPTKPKPEAPKSHEPAPAAMRRAAAPAVSGPAVSGPVQASAPPSPQPNEPKIDPQWTVGDGAFSDPARRADAIAFARLEDRLRVQRACNGQSSEHLTEEEKRACAAYWSRAH